MNKLTEQENWRFEGVEKRCCEAEKNIALLREFVKTHRSLLIAWDNWHAYVWDGSVTFTANDDHTAKDIAKAFGADGWTRRHNSSSCGQIDWYKTNNGVPLCIAAAETIKPKLIEEVKLT